MAAERASPAFALSNGAPMLSVSSRPALSPTVFPPRFASPIHKPRRSLLHVAMMADDPIPDAIVEAEAKATPMRPVRQQAYVLLGAISLIAGGGIAASKQGGVAAADSFAASVPILFSPEITEAACAMVAVGCFYFLYAEEQTKQENLKRILARFEEKKTKVVGSNRDDRRMKEKEAKLQQKQAQREREQAAQGTKAPVPRPQPEDRGADARKQGLLEKVEKSSFKSGWLNDINDVSRSQAMQLNSMLEGAGVLPKVTEDGSAANDPVVLEGTEATPAPSASKSSRTKKKGKKRRK